jgi:hypothetical protein
MAAAIAAAIVTAVNFTRVFHRIVMVGHTPTTV